MKTERLDKLYHRYIKDEPRLKDWTSTMLGKRLEALGLIKIVEGSRYHYLPQFEPYMTQESFKSLIPTLLEKEGRMHSVIKALCIVALIGLSSCSSPPKKQGFNLPPALSEVFRGGQLKGLESNTDGDLGIPSQNALVQRVCSSAPVYDFYGRYLRTDVQCF